MGGKVDVVKGRIKEAAGALTGNDKLRDEGKTDKAFHGPRGGFGGQAAAIDLRPWFEFTGRPDSAPNAPKTARKTSKAEQPPARAQEAYGRRGLNHPICRPRRFFAGQSHPPAQWTAARTATERLFRVMQLPC